MKKYDTYKPTKIDFLDEIPQHWEEKRMRFLGYLYGGLSGKSATDFNQLSNEDNKYFIPFTNIANNFRINPESLQTVVISKNENQNTVQKGDLFFLMSSENYDDVGKSAVLLDDLEETYLNSFCKGFRVTKENIVPEFLNYQLHSKQLRHNLLTGANGFTRINLKIDKVIDLLTAIPTPEEQTAIAAYLDRKTAEIDELIADKKRLLELYEEEKTAMINQAVTKGLNHDYEGLEDDHDLENQKEIKPSGKSKKSRFRQSGIEWLGEIPEHWEVKRLKYVGKTKYGLGQPPKQKIDGLPIIRATNVFRGRIDEKDLIYVDPDDIPYERDPILRTDDIVVVRSGAYTADSAIIPSKFDGAVTGYDMVFRCKKDYCPKFVSLCFLSDYILKRQLAMHSLRAAQPHLNREELGETLIAVPPFNEQRLIVRHIETECARIDAKKAKTEKLIELLTEYRSALISEVVTGKVKVIP